ncbi:beta-galactosidase [uncultured Victivallis sp.]|uniref:beta-galactosidase n=1 Tax=uncultured Victivallis sp. TaxID=354118 RepID=UPI0025DB1D05|nr:beta-galactosidase [uncultured Victivallis sp.]
MVRCHRFILPLLMMTGSVFGIQLVNPTFDTEHGWEKWRDGKQVERRLSENGRNGRCAFISAPAGEKGAYLQRLKNPVPGNYEFGCWFRTSLGKKCAQLQVTGKRAGKTAFMRSVSLPGSLEWKETSLAFQVPPDTTELIVTLFVADGKAWFDDVTLKIVSEQKALSLEGNWKFYPGDAAEGFRPELNDTAWKEIKVPALWEKEGYPELEGFAWYRRKIKLPDHLKNNHLMLVVGGISKADETFFDGVRIGKQGSFPPGFKGDTFGMRRYLIPARLTTGAGEHTLAIRVHDGAGGQSGGIWISPVQLQLAEPEEYRKVTLVTAKNGNLFSPGEPVEFTLKIDDLAGSGVEQPLLRGTVRRYDRSTAAVFTCRPVLREGKGEFRHTLGPLPEGFYYLETTLEAADGLTAGAEFTFGVLPEKTEIQDSRFGIACHLNRLHDAEFSSSLELLKRIGVKTIRTGFLWKDAEPSPGEWNWKRFDRTVRGIRDSGMELTATLAGAPAWASTDPLERRGLTRKSGRQPQSDRFAQYAERIAERYRKENISWEIWNEPNLKSYWKPIPESYEYFQLLSAGYRGVAKGDPAACVLTAGLVPYRFVSDPDVAAELFLDDLYEYAGEERIFDRIAYHPYPVMRKGITNSDLERQLREMIGRLRSVRNHHEDQAGFRLTEIGAPDLPRTIDERRQAEVLTVLLTLCAADPEIEQVHWYNLQEDGDNPDYNEHNYGIVHSDFSPKPALFALRHIMRMLDGAEFKECKRENEVVIHHFLIHGVSRWVVWSDHPIQWRLPTGVAGVTGMMGETIEPENGMLEIGSAPVYLEFGEMRK